MRCFWVFVILIYPLTWAQVLEAKSPKLEANMPLEAALLQETNKARLANGQNELVYDELLAQAARAHAKEMSELNYFSHESPDLANKSPADRLANAGSSLVFMGENIAKMPGADIAVSTTEGWMNSPGHRQNLLEPLYTHVGFGTAQDGQGFTYVVQVLAYQPFKLVAAQLQSRQGRAYQIVFNAKTSAPTTAIFGYGKDQSEPTSLNAGDNPTVLKTMVTGKIHLDASVLAPAGGGYIIQDGGWIDLDTATYQPDSLSEKYALEIQGLTVYPEDLIVSDIVLTFDGALAKDLAVFVGDKYQPQGLESGTLRLSLPQNEDSVIAVGEVLEGNQVRIVHQIKVNMQNGQAKLFANAAN